MAAIDDLMAALSSNAELRQAMTNATSSVDAAKAAAAAGYKVTSQELIEAYKSRMEEMSEDQLSSVAGGKDADDVHDADDDSDDVRWRRKTKEQHSEMTPAEFRTDSIQRTEIYQNHCCNWGFLILCSL